MITLISPSKTMNPMATSPFNPLPQHPLSDELRAQLLEMTTSELSTLYKSSDKVAKQAKVHLNTPKAYEAIQLYNGAVFSNLDFTTLSLNAQEYLYNTVMIFSAMYGIIHAGTPIQPYRLDLTTRLPAMKQTLAARWKPIVTQRLNGLEHDMIIDLSSTEYRKLLTPKLKAHVISIDFKDQVGESFKTKGTYAKMARGRFLRLMSINQATTLDEIKELTVMGYRLNPSISSENNLVYTR